MELMKKDVKNLFRAFFLLKAISNNVINEIIEKRKNAMLLMLSRSVRKSK
jgi:hypothetical protein